MSLLASGAAGDLLKPSHRNIMEFWKQDIKLTVSIHVELQIINGKWMFMSLIVISDNDKPFRISQFSVWRIFIINSVKVQQNLFSSGFQNFHEFYLWKGKKYQKISVWVILVWSMVTSRDSVAAAVLLFLSGLHKLEPLVLISLERLVGVARVLVALSRPGQHLSSNCSPLSILD